jgi:hypothetical protein
VHDRHDHPQDQRGAAEQAEVTEELEQRGVAGERRAAAGAQQDHREDADRAPERGQHDPVYQLGDHGQRWERRAVRLAAGATLADRRGEAVS